MTSSLDQMLEPEEWVLERGTRSGFRPGWRYWKTLDLWLLGILAVAVWGAHYGIWQVDYIYILVAFALLLAAAPFLEILVKTRGRYTAEAVITTRRVLAGTGGRKSGVEELRLGDVTSVKFIPGLFEMAGVAGLRFFRVLFEDEHTIVSGRQGKVFCLTHSGSGQRLALAIAAATKQPPPWLPGPMRQRFARIVIWILCFITIVGLTLLYFVMPIFIYYRSDMFM